MASKKLSLPSCELFRVVIIGLPTLEERKQGKYETLLLGPELVLAPNKEAAIISAMQKHSEFKYNPAMTRVVVTNLESGDSPQAPAKPCKCESCANYDD